MLRSILATAAYVLLSFISTACADVANTPSSQAGSYHFKATLSDANASLRHVKLTWPVISNLLQENLHDLQVYNADLQAVPFTIRSVAASEQAQQQTQSLNFFPMGDIEKLGTILKRETNKQRYQAIKLIQTGQRYLIIDSSSADGSQTLPLQKLILHWKALDHWLPKSLRVEASDNLLHWQPLTLENLPYRMTKHEVVLENNELQFKRPIHKRFIRLSGDEDFEPLLKALDKVTGYYHQTRLSQPLNWNKVSLTPTKMAQQYRYNLPPSLPVKQWRLSELVVGSLYKGRLYTRSAHHVGQKPDDWQLSQKFLQYSIQMDDGLVNNTEAFQVMHWRGVREWRIDFEQAVTANTPPKLALAWEPLELVFLAQGKGPFEIRYGSLTAPASTRMNLEKLLKTATPAAVEVEAITQLSEVITKKSESQYKYLLWVLLATAVLMLLYMARGLLREMES